MDAEAYDFALKNWQTDREAFSAFFVRQSQFVANSVGYFVQVDEARLAAAHAAWAAACVHWKNERVDPKSNGLSHVKVLSLLLHHLVSNEWCSELFEGGSGAQDEERWKGKVDLREQIRKCLRAGRGKYLAFQFVIRLINWFETHRTDWSGQFSFRLTPDLEHDLMVYFASEKQDELSTYLIMKALYSRPGETGN